MDIYGTLTLGELIDLLDEQPPNNPIEFDFCGHIPGSIDSYRGFYEHLAIDPNGSEPTTVGRLLGSLREAVGEEFEGYKGGLFRMTRETPIWVSERSQASGTMITGIQYDGYRTFIRTAHAAD